MILDSLVPVGAVISALAALLNIVGASLYDLERLQQRRQQQLHPYSKRNRRRPLVSAVVLSDNCQDTISSCLKSLTSSRYPKLEVIVADNASADDSRQVARQFIAAHSKKTLRLYVRRRRSTPEQLLAGAIKKTKGEIIMVLHAEETLGKHAIAQAVKYFNAEPDLQQLVTNYKLHSTYKLAGLFQEFSLLLQARTKKAESYYRTLSSVERSASFYTKEALVFRLSQLKRASGVGSNLKAAFADDVTIYGPARPFPVLLKQTYALQANRVKAWPARLFSSYKQPRQVMGLARAVSTGLAIGAAPILLAYFTYLSLRLHQPAFLAISALAASLLLLFAIWEDGQLSLSAKLGYILLMPVSYGWFYLMSLVHCLALLGGSFPAPAKKVRPLTGA